MATVKYSEQFFHRVKEDAEAFLWIVYVRELLLSMNSFDFGIH